MWFVGDEAPAHFATVVRHVLVATCPTRWIGRPEPVGWLSRLPELNLLMFFLLGYMETLV